MFSITRKYLNENFYPPQMKCERKIVIFANKEMENRYKRLAVPEHPEDRRLYLTLRNIRSKVRSEYHRGEEIPKDKIPAIYRQMFHIDNLWKLNPSKHEVVFYSIVRDDILIVDIL